MCRGEHGSGTREWWMNLQGSWRQPRRSAHRNVLGSREAIKGAVEGQSGRLHHVGVHGAKDFNSARWLPSAQPTG